MVDFVFIDSGTGGIPYLHRLLEKSPNSSCVYIGDTKNFPYGEKTNEQVIDCVLSLIKLAKEIFVPKVIVIACNTMSVNALEIARKQNPDIQIVGTVPAIKTAAKVSKKRKIGLLATNSSVKNQYNQKLKEEFAFDCQFFLRGDPDLISFIEHKSFLSTQIERENAVKPAVDFFRKNDCDVIILGCTHFLNLKNEIQSVSSPDILVVDSVEGVVNHALEVLGENHMEKKEEPKLFVTGFLDNKDEFEYNKICSKFNLKWGGIIKN